MSSGIVQGSAAWIGIMRLGSAVQCSAVRLDAVWFGEGLLRGVQY